MLRGFWKLTDTGPQLLEDEVDVKVPKALEEALKKPLEDVVDASFGSAPFLRSIL